MHGAGGHCRLAMQDVKGVVRKKEAKVRIYRGILLSMGEGKSGWVRESDEEGGGERGGEELGAVGCKGVEWLRGSGCEGVY